MAYIRTPFAASGDKTAIPEGSQIDGSISMTDGWGTDYQADQTTDPDAKNVGRQTTNWLLNLLSVAIQQYQQHGVPEFITSSDNDGSPYSYSKNDIVRFNPGSGYQNYVSLVDSNTTDPTNTTNWRAIIYIDPEPTGTVKEYWGLTAPTGYVFPNGTSIGDASSGATQRANADTLALFTLLWNSVPQSTLPMQNSSGVVTARGASAAAECAWYHGRHNRYRSDHDCRMRY